MLRAAVETGQWHDAALEAATALGELARCTNFARNSDGARIDAIFCNSTAASALRDVGVLENTGLPGHLLVVAGFSFEAYGQRVRRIARPIAFDSKQSTEAIW